MKFNKYLLIFTTFLILCGSFVSGTVFAAYTSPYAEPTILIRNGSYGTGVKWVQDMLNHNGYNLTVDGTFGNNTLSAVKNFQSKYKLTVDGIVGNATKNVLKKNALTTNNSSSNFSNNENMMYTTANLNLRNGASTSYSIILTIPKNSSVTIISNNANGWSLVKYNSTYGFVSRQYLTTRKPTTTSSSITSTNSNNSTNTNNSTISNQQFTSSKLPAFNRISSNLMTIIKNCKAYYANNKFYYSLANGVRSIPADNSKPYGDYNRYYTDCSNYVSWVLYEYALANNKPSMKNYFSYQRNSATFKTIGDNGGNSYLTVISKRTSTSNVNLAQAKPGDILVSPGHVEFFNSYVLNSNGSITLKVYNCGSTSTIQVPGITTSATKNLNDITYILRIK
ncbi:MAG: peptidoglycan-binding protein [Clostridia bacterium]|nr:peptidoglycan-binding protein [Clostridia bacterium]